MDKLTSELKYNIDTLIVDPPRAGLHTKVVEALLQLKSDLFIMFLATLSLFFVICRLCSQNIEFSKSNP